MTDVTTATALNTVAGAVVEQAALITDAKIPNEQLKKMSAKDLLGVNFSDVEGFDFTAAPKGNYNATIKAFGLKEEGTDSWFEISLESVIIVEPTNDLTAAEQKLDLTEGTLELAKRYYGGGGARSIVTTYGPIAEALGIDDMAEFMAAMVGMAINFDIAHRKNQDNPDQPYIEFRNVVPAA